MKDNVWFISDTHFGHANILNFKDNQGNKLRPFSTVEEMHRTMVDNWNRVVGKDDRVYHLGDIAMSTQALKWLTNCNGNKILIRGNHDKYKLKEYLPFFMDIRGMCKFQWNSFTAWLSHIPMHPQSLGRIGYNIHGHLHSNRVLTDDGNIDQRYISVCVEQINYTPIHIKDIVARLSGY